MVFSFLVAAFWILRACDFSVILSGEKIEFRVRENTVHNKLSDLVNRGLRKSSALSEFE